MEKFLSNRCNSIVYDIENNSVKSNKLEYNFTPIIYVAEDDGEFISREEVIPYKKGNILLLFQHSMITKCVVIDELVTCFDIIETMRKVNEEIKVKNKD